MAFNPGRNVGRVSIRAVPDTTGFRKDLKRKLDAIERRTSMSVRVNRADVSRARIEADIRRQMDSLRDFAVDAKVRFDEPNLDKRKFRAQVTPTVDQLTLERLRRDIVRDLRDIEVRLQPTMEDRAIRARLNGLRNKFDELSGELAHSILSEADAEKLRIRLHRVKEEIDEVTKKRTARIDINPFTAWANARLRWLTRPRTVEVFVKISKSSMVAALTTLAALSGARLSWKWIDNLLDKIRELDKNLPRLVGWTTGLTSLAASLFAATSGLVGIGQGLFSILPAFLVLPGLILNAIGSAVALIVALKNAKDELSDLADDMNELGDIINTTFWDRARQPIVDLVKGLMPQLRNAFRDLAEGIGDFTAAMSQAFGEELANGRLEAIFRGIADGWRVLGSGAKGFAGALVSLSQIAATYTPRLAGWFVRQANTFDAWLKAIAEDGRLGRWMEDAIDSMYDLWDVTRGVSGVFTGLWTAAEAAGSTGLAGFADLMLRWREIVQGADFQKGLTAVFRGSYDAMSAFGEAIRAVGRVFVNLSGPIERFIGRAGQFLGGFVEAVANALNSPAVGNGLDDFSSGLIGALRGIRPSLQPIADTFGNFLGLLGDLASNLLPTAAAVLADLMPVIDRVIQELRDSGVLSVLNEALTSVSAALGPALESFVAAVGPPLIQALERAAEAFVNVAPVLARVVEGLGKIIGGALEADNWVANAQAITFDVIFGGLPISGPEMDARLRQIIPLDDIRAMYEEVLGFFRELPQKIQTFVTGAPEWLVAAGQRAMSGLVNGITTGFQAVVTFMQELPTRIPGFFATAGTWLGDAGARLITGLGNGLIYGFTSVASFFMNLPSTVQGFFSSAVAWLTTSGSDIMNGLLQGISSAAYNVFQFLSTLPSRIVGAFAGAGMWLINVGASMIDGLIAGISSAARRVADAAVSVVSNAIGAVRGFLDIHSPSRRVARMVGRPMGEGIGVGFADGLSGRGLSTAKASLDRMLGDLGDGSAGATGRVFGGNTVHVTQPLLPGETPAEQRENLVRELKYV